MPGGRRQNNVGGTVHRLRLRSRAGAGTTGIERKVAPRSRVDVQKSLASECGHWDATDHRPGNLVKVKGSSRVQKKHRFSGFPRVSAGTSPGAGGFTREKEVEHRRFELLTSSLRTKRSTN